MIYYSSPPPDQMSSILSLSCYCPLHHFLIQSTSTSRALSFPVSIRNGQKRLESFFDIYSLLLSQPSSLLGGLRYEIRVAAPHPLEALRLVHQRKPYNLQLLSPEVFTLSINNYLIALPQLLDLAKDELSSLGFSFSHRPPPPNATTTITNPQRNIFGDLKRLFGETSFPNYATDPIDPDAWWRRRPHIQNFVPLPDIVLLTLTLFQPDQSESCRPLLMNSFQLSFGQR